MNNKLLIKKVLKKYSDSEYIYPLRKYSYTLSHGKERDCRRIIRIIDLALSDSDATLDLELLIGEFKKLKDLQDTEIHLILYALTHVVFLHLENGRISPEAACLILSQAHDTHMKTVYEKLSQVNRILLAKDPYHYRSSDHATQELIRKRIYSYAKKHRISQIEAAKIYRKEYDEQYRSIIAKAFFPFTLISSLAITLALSTLIGVLPCIFLFLPVFELLRMLALYFISRFKSPGFIPRLKGDHIPPNARTAVMITSLVDKGNISKLLESLEDYYNRNPEENAVFGILGDLSECDSEYHKSDEEIISRVRQGIRELNSRYGEHFCFFIRRRKFSLDRKKFFGWERKRGALIDLCAFLESHKNEPFLEYSFPSEFKCRYLITLDFDTVLTRGDARRMVLAMLHPENQPTVKNGVVVSGYGIMQPRVVLSPESATATPFCLTLFGSGGSDNYRVPSFDFYQSLFGKGLFCGKGIIDIEAFNRVAAPAFAEDRILSHDILEGTYLRCGYLSDTVLLDSCPQSPISYYKRLHRWIRGDIQASLYLKGQVIRADGSKIPNPIDRISRHMLWDNILRAFLYPCIFIFLIISLLASSSISPFWVLIPLLPVFLPFIITVFSSFGIHPRRFYSNILERVCHCFCLCLYYLCALPSESFIALDAVLRSLWRMNISGQNLLEWTTAEAHEKLKKGALTYFLKFLPSTLTGIIFIVLASHPVFDFFGTLWLLFPVIALALSSPYPKKPPLSRQQRLTLTEYCRDAWGFYSELVNDSTHHLPPDNFQERPSPVIAERTSPTNIGLYLICIALAHKFGFVKKSEALSRIRNTLKTLKALPKFQGHLYNWYDTSTLGVIGTPYISTVDSGNLLACLIALCSALEEIGDSADEIKLARELIEATHFDFLYNKQKKLLSLGFNTATRQLSESCYDLLMSEARTAVYISTANNDVPGDDAWYRMGRPLTLKNGHVGVMSWSGSAFEYFMPAIFLPIYHGSIFYEAMGFALAGQISCKADKFWGRSESAYFSYDYDMNYQYRAFGVPELSYDMENRKNDVISPYSSFLFLACARNAPLSNLSRLKKFGAYGKYGFYEAIDFTKSRVGDGHAIIYSYMAHHVGMSIASAANAVFGDLIIRWFLSEPKMRSAKTLLYEMIPQNVDRISLDTSPKLPPAFKKAPVNNIKSMTSAPDPALLPESSAYIAGKMRLCLLANGRIYAYYSDKALFHPSFSGNGLRGFGIRFMADNKIIDPLSSASSFTSYLTGAVFKGQADGISYETDFSLSERYNAICIDLAVSGNFKSITSMVFFEPILDTVKGYLAHPAFSGLFVSSRFIESSNLLVFSRKAREGNHKTTFLGIYPFCSTGISFITRRDDAFSSMYSAEDVNELIRSEFPSRDGACINPFCAVKKTSSTPSGRYRISFLVLAADSYGELVGNLAKLLKNKSIHPHKLSSFFSKQLAPYARQNYLIASADMNVIRLCSVLRSRFLLCPKPIGENIPLSTKNALYSLGISSDLPLVCIFLYSVPDMATKKIISAFSRACRYMKLLGEEFDLLFVCSGEDESDPYKSPIRHALTSEIAHAVGYSPLFRRGGIFISSRPEEWEILPFAKVFVSLKQPDILLNLIESIRKDHHCDPCIIKRSLHKPQKAMNGSFCPDGFLINKGKSSRPWSYIYSTRLFGTLLTSSSLGFTWYRNSRQMRLTPWSNDPLLECDGEIVSLELCKEKFDLAAISDKVFFRRDCALYSGSVAGVIFELEVGISSNLPLKYIKVSIKNGSCLPLHVHLDYHITPECGDGSAFSYKKNTLGDYFTVSSTDTSENQSIVLFTNAAKKSFYLKEGAKQSHLYVLGAFNRFCDKGFYYMTNHIKKTDFVSRMKRDYLAFISPVCDAFSLKCPDKSLENIFNFYLPYTALITRQLARTGFYQSGGAYGFRDQLQDALCLGTVHPDGLKMQIIRCAKNQFFTGDVLHWWHESITGEYRVLGVRSRCSDDFLWLVFALCEYVRITGDLDILDIRINYLDAPMLLEGELERCLYPSHTEKKESLFYHCIRAVRLGLSNISSENGLCLMGSCDWNDGFSLVGALGKGTSVWLSLFFSIILKSFADICQRIRENDFAREFYSSAQALEKAVNDHCYNGEYYLRGFYDDGSALGDLSSTECKIDILPQAFAVFAFGKNGKTEGAILNAFHKLFDPDGNILCLFTPPFDNGEKNPGYIASYVPGVRENGGQYTHAALWAASAFFKLENPDIACRILRCTNPASRYEGDPLVSSAYGGEPYAMAGDIYSNPDHKGRAGWTHYTGAAGWLFRTVLMDLLGYEPHPEFNGFSIRPRLCPSFSSFELDVALHGTHYKISAELEDKDQWILDGRPHKNEFIFDKKDHYLKIYIAKN